MNITSLSLARLELQNTPSRGMRLGNKLITSTESCRVPSLNTSTTLLVGKEPETTGHLRRVTDTSLCEESRAVTCTPFPAFAKQSISLGS